MTRHAWIPDDRRLSYAARGLLGELTGYGDDWQPETPESAARRVSGERAPMVAEDSVTIGGLHDELVAAGYAIRQHGGRLALCRDRELAMRSARLGGEHLRLTTPRLTRDERAAWLTAVDAVMLRGHHDPETVGAALARFRERRRAGEPGDPSLLESVVTSLELAAARDRAGYDPDDAAVWCGSGCGGYHRETDPCFAAEDDGSRVFG